MIDIKLIRDNPELVKENIKKKFQNEKLTLVDKAKKLDEQWRKEKYKLDDLRAQRNKTSEEINQLMKQKEKEKAQNLIKKAKEIANNIQKGEETEKKLEQELKEIMMQIPNIMHSSVPIGKNDTENVEIETFGKITSPTFTPKNHVELTEGLGILDFETSATTSGTGFYFMKGDLALLNMALINFARDHMVKNGFTYVEPPLMLRNETLQAVYSNEEIENMAYKIDNEDLYLIATSEHPLIGQFIDKTLTEKELPIKQTSYSMCFRKEIGSHGINEKGIYRTHQFNKQEMIIVCKPNESYQWYDKLLKLSIEIFKALEIPFRVLECCSGDLANLKAKSCDLEAWSPVQQKYFEVTSLTNMEEAQSRRLGLKATNGKEKYYPHTLNNTAIATSRALVAIIENHQQKDGSIKIPKALQPYMNGKKKIEKQ